MQLREAEVSEKGFDDLFNKKGFERGGDFCSFSSIGLPKGLGNVPREFDGEKWRALGM